MPAAPPVQLAPGTNTPTGEVRFVVDGQQPGVLVPLAGLGSSLLFSEATPGTHTVQAFFADYPDFSTEAASPPLTLPFSAGPDGTSITSPLTVTLAAPSFGRSVTLTDAQGHASVAVQANTKGGSYSALVSVSGLSAASFKLTNLFATTTTLKANTVNLVFGQSVILTSTVSAPAGMARATGSVTFFDEGDPVATVPLVKGVAKLVVSNLDVGSDSYTAVYSGNAVYATSTSSTVSTSTAQARTSMRLTTSSKTPQFGDTVTLTATLRTVKPATGVANGTVTFLDGSSVLGTASLVDDVASFSTSALAVGGHSITAVYGGDDSFLTGKSAALAETVVLSTAGGSGKNSSGAARFGPDRLIHLWRVWPGTRFTAVPAFQPGTSKHRGIAC